MGSWVNPKLMEMRAIPLYIAPTVKSIYRPGLKCCFRLFKQVLILKYQSIIMNVDYNEQNNIKISTHSHIKWLHWKKLDVSIVQY